MRILRAFVVFTFVGLAGFRAGAQDVPSLILTPPAPPDAQIHGPKVFGVRPGHSFLFTIAATGSRPMAFSADHLPAGLVLDSGTGQITGTAPAAGDYVVTLHAGNPLGQTTRVLTIKVGKEIALTPPMGWNSWNCLGEAVTQKDVEAAADAMVSSGLANHGWTYVNVDDAWQVNPDKAKEDPTFGGPERNPDGSIHPNQRFPDMKAMADYIHAKGLKAGLYSSPGPYTCGGCTGSYRHEKQDTAQYAAWGFDYLKYDWCTYGDVSKKESPGGGLDELKKPYAVMAAALHAVPRDIVFSFCQYGMGDVWKWGAETGGNSWRTTGDIHDSWENMRSNAWRSRDLGQYAGPGHWNDPDMLVVGKVGGWDGKPHPTQLTPDEQYSHLSLWCLQASPLLIGCDLTQLDAFTLGLLTNDEVLDVDQDELGHAANLLRTDYPYPTAANADNAGGTEIWARPLADGSVAVGLFNLGTQAVPVYVTWDELHLAGKQNVRDLWRQKDLGAFEDKFETPVAPHGVVLVRITKG
jgi:alpha-galactosidase